MKMIVISFAVFMLLLSSTAFIITQGQQAILLRLGVIVKNNSGEVKILNPGLHFKVPLIYQKRLFDTRLQTLDIQSSRIVTAEKKDVIVDYYVKWRISNLALYYTRTGGNRTQAILLLEQQLNDNLRAEFGKRTITDVISDDRVDIMENINNQVNLTAKNLGIDVIDVRIKRIDLPMEVSTAVFERMRAERERIATEHRAQGKAQAEAVRATADANVTLTLAQATAQAAQLRSEGDAQAALVYTAAYTKDAGFYEFYRSMSAYQAIFNNKNDLLVVQPQGEFFRNFIHPQTKS
ncbi:MAG: HflC protein [Gammaproteobacteria bacterium RIFCSPLOWO2_02_FULL_38_11]|nr:MAG: HflC protein [Gammaproteobacteria bacterium RIFCSPHIGHO2_02_FULL_38_33]OGT23516.1 MAG: HflC protein [Gammaproteobacteria bacterium RIFCSPHIGHO2_12_38_15]OGT69644.1 MAG: HflC protein [Gammaproteobacteria bacterium RIFCSPLOWO2_02_FULL_38_11]OGT75494.1 MAG: HflC protein [Gammaproteobacteria bacterium RIFCSPLOWO2_12_FULL_38_14]